MKKILLIATLGLGFSLGAHAANITQMHTATFGHYTQTYGGTGSSFMTFSAADYYTLNNNTTWQAGAGWHPNNWSNLVSTQVNNNTLRYTFTAPANGILFQNTDYDSGDHSSQGVLGFSGPLIIEAQAGSTTGKLSGYATILSNTETWYGQPRFNFYAANVGQKVYFEQNYSLLGTSFTADLFQRQFVYNETGVVDFTRVAAVPEPSTYFLMLVGLTAVGVFAAKRKKADLTTSCMAI